MKYTYSFVKRDTHSYLVAIPSDMDKDELLRYSIAISSGLPGTYSKAKSELIAYLKERKDRYADAIRKVRASTLAEIRVLKN